MHARCDQGSDDEPLSPLPRQMVWVLILVGWFLCLALFREAAALIIGRDAVILRIGGGNQSI